MADATLTRTQRLQIRKWDPETVKAGNPMTVLKELMVDLPIAHDPARDAAKARALSLTGAKRARGCSALVGGGFVVNVEL